MTARKKQNTRTDRNHFVTVVLDNMKMSVDHRKKKNKDYMKRVMTRHQLSTLVLVTPLYNCAETVMSHVNGSTGAEIPRKSWTGTKDITIAVEKEDCWTNFENQQLGEARVQRTQTGSRPLGQHWRTRTKDNC